MQNPITHPKTHNKARFKIGDVVVLGTFMVPLDEIGAGKAIEMEQPIALVPPFMVVVAMRRNQAKPKDQAFKDDKQLVYKCAWFDAKDGVFKEANFYEPLLQLVRAQKQALKKDQLKFGQAVALLTQKVEALKLYGEQPSRAFMPPAMLITGYEVNDKAITKNRKGEVEALLPAYYVKCKWYNAAKAKFMEDKFAIEAIELA
ncbi:hypothetical protein [Microscilla marina]|uniref:Uncharacterized protein n=1 Tax=Microscilla marina ATCC 23134 TaxID=313606 RepID=A1ZWF0_MICM2|nr:hypothetical protein [Microscilla marina]EAY25290.1 hypothetical protein M23134_02760 [Microscilla marina ATCC 23134]